MKPKCDKKKFDRIGALNVVANAKKESQFNHDRKEKRIYFCRDCKAYHVSSKGSNDLAELMFNRK